MAEVGCEVLIIEGESVTVSRRGGGLPEKRWRCGTFPSEHIEQLFALADEGLVDVFNVDLTDVGFTGWPRVMPDLVDAGVKASTHTWAGTPRPYYCAHPAAGVGNVLIVEGIPGTAKGMDYSAWKFQDGKLVVSNERGFGLRLSLCAAQFACEERTVFCPTTQKIRCNRVLRGGSGDDRQLAQDLSGCLCCRQLAQDSSKIVQNVMAESWVFAYSCIATLLKRPKAEVPYRGRFLEILCQ